MITLLVAQKKFLSHQQTNSRMTKGYVSQDTIRTYDGGLRRFIKYLNDRRVSVLEAVTADHVKGYLASLREDGLQATSVALQRVILRSFFHWANDHYTNITDVSKDVQKIRVEHREAKHLDGNQIESLLAFLWKDRKSKRRNAMLFELMIRTGARVGEITGMNLDAVQLSPQCIEISLLGKGNKQRSLSIPLLPDGQPGSAEIRRFHGRLEEYFGRRRRWRVKEGHQRALFLSNSGHRIRPRNIQAAFKYYVKRLNLTGFTPHSLRHSHVTNLLQKGVDVATIAKMVGHSSPTVTLSIYSHTDPHQMKEASTKAFI